MNNNDEAVKLYNEAEKYFNEAEKYFNAGEYDEAIECLKKISPSYEKYNDVLNGLGTAYSTKKNYDLAIEFFNKIPKNYENYNYVLLNLGVAYASKGQNDLAIKYYKQIPKNYEKYNYVLLNLGVAYGNKGQNDLAIEYYKQIPKSYENYNYVLFNLGTAYASKEEYDLAIEYYKQIPKNYEHYNEVLGNSVTAYNNNGNVYADLKKHDEAIKNYSKAIELDPNFSEAYSNKGIVYGDLGKYDEAIAYFNKSIELDPNYSFAYNNKGIVYGNLKKYDEAIAYLNKAIEINPNYTNAYNNKSIALVALAENEKTKKLDKEWTKKASDHYIKWLEICINKNIVDYSTSMNIYMLRYLLLKEKDKISIKEIDELTKEYIQKIVESEHNKNDEKIKEYFSNDKDIDKIILYQYSPYNKNTIYKIKKEQMYFSDPLTFNDPFDPLVRVLDKEHSEGLVKLLNFRVSCLSPKEDNLLLWSHYADKHQGICIAYDITKLLKEYRNIIFRKIEFIEKPFPKPKLGLMFPSLNTVNKKNERETLINTFTKKHKVWDYEEEYRLILQLKTNEEKEFSPPVDIKAIYLGRDMPEKDKEFIDTMIKEMNSAKSKDIKVYDMEISDDDIFKLEAKKYDSTKK